MWLRESPLLRRAWICWFIVVAIVLLRGALQPNKGNCFPCYQQGGMNWYLGNDLYAAVADTCRYSPIVHAGFAPFSLLPQSIAATVWRLFESILLLGSLAYWMNTALPASFGDRERSWLVLLTIPLMMGNLNAGQSNAMVMAGILCGIAALHQRRFWLAALSLAIACSLKIYPLALVLLLMIVYRRELSWRFAIALVALMALPFVLKDPTYAARQYGRWLDNLVDDDRSTWPLVNGFRDGWMLVRMIGVPLSFAAYRVFTMLAGIFIGWFVWQCCRSPRRDDRDFLNVVLALGCCWMTVFGPATEGHTYILLGPSLALLAIEARRGLVPDGSRGWFYFGLGSFLVMLVIQATPLIHVPVFLILMPLGSIAVLVALIRLHWPGSASAATTAPFGPRLWQEAA